MRLVVFTGPTLSADEVRARLPHVEVREPAAHGDVYRAVRDGATHIGIVDGYFEHTMSIWHKELLWGLSRGVVCAGAASMGAIRASELAAHGMVGVGAIFRAFLRGEVDDDEVAVAHGPADTGYLAMSVALADIRATLEAAVAQRVIDSEARAALLSTAKSTFYPDRSFHELLRAGTHLGIATSQLDALSAWLPTGRVHQKRLDALELVEYLAALPDEPLARRPLFPNTGYFSQMCRVEDAVGDVGVDAWSGTAAEEFAMQPDLAPTVAVAAVARTFAIALADHAAMVPDQQLLDEASDALRRRLGLLDVDDLEGWLDDNDLTFADYTELVHREAKHRWAQASLPAVAGVALLDELRLAGVLGRLERRAKDKAHVLRAAGHDESGRTLGNAADEADQAIEWFYRERLHRDVPADLANDARTAGFADSVFYERAIRREHAFERLRAVDGAAG